ncbi:Ser/Thr protein phosphatase family protein [Sulfitobacter noctilucae]|uniref:metallophosphoesterase n=1 Tax=Sulfitobacter noctilucae TaxID=1342302 RepID=UPI00046AB110|nr:metallophosphoesterase [Sulfitobacter noctilucae]KIN60461.1 Ser/Thr protein phosphatase family protein [Sulfitobacter noctilucae]
MPSDLLFYKSYRLPWRELPSSIPDDTEAFVIGDVHGQADLLAQVLKEIKEVPREAQTRHLVFLGDLIDRGPSSIEAVNLAMRAGELAGADNLHVLPGNHDVALYFGLSSESVLSFWVGGGGKTVLSEIGVSEQTHTLAEITGKLLQAFHPEYLRWIGERPSHLRLGDLIFVHAGVHPDGDIDEFLAQDHFFLGVDDHWATMRYPFLSHQGGWNSRDPDPDRRDRRPTVIVHGHTPALRTDLVSNEDLEICDGIEIYRTIALDIGAAYRRQLAYGRFLNQGGVAQVQIHAVAGFDPLDEGDLRH